MRIRMMNVQCGQLAGKLEVFDDGQIIITAGDGDVMKPSGFETAAGSSAGKWKQSIKDCVSGKSLGEVLPSDVLATRQVKVREQDRKHASGDSVVRTAALPLRHPSPDTFCDCVVAERGTDHDPGRPGRSWKGLHQDFDVRAQRRQRSRGTHPRPQLPICFAM